MKERIDLLGQFGKGAMRDDDQRPRRNMVSYRYLKPEIACQYSSSVTIVAPESEKSHLSTERLRENINSVQVFVLRLLVR